MCLLACLYACHCFHGRPLHHTSLHFLLDVRSVLRVWRSMAFDTMTIISGLACMTYNGQSLEMVVSFNHNEMFQSCSNHVPTCSAFWKCYNHGPTMFQPCSNGVPTMFYIHWVGRKSRSLIIHPQCWSADWDWAGTCQMPAL